jgi:hypothetical protein
MDSFVKVIEGLFGGLLTYYISTPLLAALVPGTSTTDNLLKTFLPYVLAIGVLVYALSVLGGGLGHR